MRVEVTVSAATVAGVAVALGASLGTHLLIDHCRGRRRGGA